jgi:hypothetical protein
MSDGESEVGAINHPNHLGWQESGFQHVQCCTTDEIVAVPLENSQSTRHCPACGVNLRTNSFFSRVEERFPGLFLTSGIFLSTLAIAWAAQYLPVNYGNGEYAADQITLVGVALVFIVSLGLATMVNYMPVPEVNSCDK